MKNLLTICVVTKNHSSNLRKLFEYHSKLNWFNKVNWIISDNSTRFSDKIVSNELSEIYKVDCRFSYTFSDARNKAILFTKTKYFMFLDDDDHLSENFYKNIVLDILDKDKPDFLSTGFWKEGRPCELPNYSRRIKDKIRSLNNFDNYVNDRKTKIYICGAGIVFDRKFWIDNNIKFICDYVDDIYPVLKAYILSKNPIICNKLNYIYKSQRSVTAKKSDKLVNMFISDMYMSYNKLLSEFDDKYDKKLIKKSLKNSMRQLKVNDEVSYSKLNYLLENI